MFQRLNLLFLSTGLILSSLTDFGQSRLNLIESHKFYVSTANIEYNSTSGNLEIIQRIFTDDLEAVLRARYGDEIRLAALNEPAQNATLIKKYMLNQWQIKNNNKALELKYLGHKYDIDQVKIYIEVPLTKAPEILFFENKTLFDLTSDQQNIIHVKVEDQRKSLLLFSQNPNGVLNFK
jgi:hypothetical protein